MKTVEFKDVKIGSDFYFNGTTFIKKSNRTAWLINKTHWFYFSKSEICKIVLESKED